MFHNYKICSSKYVCLLLILFGKQISSRYNGKQDVTNYRHTYFQEWPISLSWGNIIGLQSYMLLCFDGSRKLAECNFLLKYNINLNNIFIKIHFLKIIYSIIEVILFNIINIKVTILGTMM